MIVAIPDIHGRFDLLEELFEKLETEWNFAGTGFRHEDDRLIFLGDMVDRGPDSFKVLQRIQNLTWMYPDNVVALLGNHEDMMIHALRTRPLSIWGDAVPDVMQLWELNGGNATKRSFPDRQTYTTDGILPEETLEWVEQLPLSYEYGHFFFSHAPLPKDGLVRGWAQKNLPASKDELIWTYDGHMRPGTEGTYSYDFPDGKVGVCGHVHQLRYGCFEPRFYENYYFLDAGCGCSDKAPLVAVNVETQDVLYAWPDKMKKRKEGP